MKKRRVRRMTPDRTAEKTAVTEKTPGDREDEEPQDTPDYDTVVGGSIVSRAKSALGKPYKWGQAGPGQLRLFRTCQFCGIREVFASVVNR